MRKLFYLAGMDRDRLGDIELYPVAGAAENCAGER